MFKNPWRGFMYYGTHYLDSVGVVFLDLRYYNRLQQLPLWKAHTTISGFLNQVFLQLSHCFSGGVNLHFLHCVAKRACSICSFAFIIGLGLKLRIKFFLKFGFMLL